MPRQDTRRVGRLNVDYEKKLDFLTYTKSQYIVPAHRIRLYEVSSECRETMILLMCPGAKS